MVAKLDLMNSEKILKEILQNVANVIQDKKLNVFEEIGEIYDSKRRPSMDNSG